MKFYICLLLLFSIPIFGNDDYFQFPDQALPERIEYEKTRKLCLFPFRNKIESDKFLSSSGEYETKNDKNQYLSNGIPSVIISGLNGFKFAYDPNVLEDVVYHAYGDPTKKPPAKKNKQPMNRNTLQDLNSGAKEALPEKDPRYIKLDVELVPMETAPLLEANLEIGRKNKCFYVITGEYNITGEDSLAFTIEFTHRKNGKIEKISETTSLKRGYQEMTSIGLKIKKMLLNKEMATIQVETGEITDALVFLDGHYAGKTPLEKTDTIAGQHAISITKEGFVTLNRVVNLKKESISKYSFTLKKSEKTGLLSVKSTPSGAGVYLGITYLGDTPLSDVVVPLGQNRIRIEKEDHIDYYSGVEIEQGKTFAVNVKLKEGKTEDYYKNRLKVFLDYTYFDFSQYSIYSIVAFYASFQYWNYRINAHRDLIRGDPVQGGVLGELALITTYQQYFRGTTDPSSLENLFIFYNYQKVIIGANEKHISDFEGFRTASAIGAISMFALAGVFHYLGVNSDAFEFALAPPMRNTVNPASPPVAESYIKFNYRF